MKMMDDGWTDGWGLVSGVVVVVGFCFFSYIEYM